MYEGPSYQCVSESELDAAIEHAQGKYPLLSIHREKLRSLMDTISERVMKEGRRDYPGVRRATLIESGIQYKSRTYEAYKSALAKIVAIRTNAHRSRRSRSHSVVIAEVGPLTPEEVAAELHLHGLGDDYIPLAS